MFCLRKYLQKAQINRSPLEHRNDPVLQQLLVCHYRVSFSLHPLVLSTLLRAKAGLQSNKILQEFIYVKNTSFKKRVDFFILKKHGHKDDAYNLLMFINYSNIIQWSTAVKGPVDYSVAFLFWFPALAERATGIPGSSYRDISASVLCISPEWGLHSSYVTDKSLNTLLTATQMHAMPKNIHWPIRQEPLQSTNITKFHFTTFICSDNLFCLPSHG